MLPAYSRNSTGTTCRIAIPGPCILAKRLREVYLLVRVHHFLEGQVLRSLTGLWRLSDARERPQASFPAVLACKSASENA